MTVEVLDADSSLGEIGTNVANGPMLLSIRTAAEQLGISTAILYEMTHRGDIETVRIGRRILISRDALQRFIDNHSRSVSGV